MDDLLELEETQRTNQQTQVKSPYDSNAYPHFPDGFTPVGDVLARGLPEEVAPGQVPAVEVTAGINDTQLLNPVSA